MVETIIAIAGAITGVGGFIFGIVKWHAANKKNTTEQIITEKIDVALSPVTEQINNIAVQLEELRTQQAENERRRIRTEIMEAVVEIQNGMTLSDVMHQHLEAEYSRYKSLNGNTYIDSQMAIIRDYFAKK